MVDGGVKPCPYCVCSKFTIKTKIKTNHHLMGRESLFSSNSYVVIKSNFDVVLTPNVKNGKLEHKQPKNVLM